jgi:hypothetical protein
MASREINTSPAWSYQGQEPLERLEGPQDDGPAISQPTATGQNQKTSWKVKFFLVGMMFILVTGFIFATFGESEDLRQWVRTGHWTQEGGKSKR